MKGREPCIWQAGVCWAGGCGPGRVGQVPAPPTSTCPNYKASREGEGRQCSQRCPKMKTALLFLVALAAAAGPGAGLGGGWGSG